jgi:hypothetical protein
LFGGIFDDILSLVKKWSPEKAYRSEGSYRDNLVEYLRASLNRPDFFRSSENHTVLKEKGRHLCDIGVDRRVGIELKFNFKSKAEADRLATQVKGILNDYAEGVIIVFCGATDMDKIDYLKQFVGVDSSTSLYNQKQIRMVVKH